MEKLFIYGTLRDKKIQEAVIGGIKNSIPDTIEGFRKWVHVFHDWTFPILIKEDREKTRWEVIEVNADELARIDAYEWYEYVREKCSLRKHEIVWYYNLRK